MWLPEKPRICSWPFLNPGSGILLSFTFIWSHSLQNTLFFISKINPTSNPKVSFQKKDSIANKINLWREGDREFCRPYVQKTAFLYVFPQPFSDPWQKVSARAYLGSSCHEEQAPFPAHTFWSIAFNHTPYCQLLCIAQEGFCCRLCPLLSPIRAHVASLIQWQDLSWML